MSNNIKWSFKEANAEVRRLGGTLRKVDGEYRMRMGGYTYYTNDLHDAVGTARAEALINDCGGAK